MAERSRPQKTVRETRKPESAASEADGATEAVRAEAAADSADSAAGEGDAAKASELDDAELERAVEALLFATSEPLAPQRLAQALGAPLRRVRAAIERLREDYGQARRAFDVREIAGGFRLYTKPELEHYVARLDAVRAPERLSASALETLAIVAYRQPIVRAEIDAIRGVQCSAILKALLERKLIRVVGRSEQPGRPMQYGTSRRFLDHFGLASVEDLPRVEDLKAP